MPLAVITDLTEEPVKIIFLFITVFCLQSTLSFSQDFKAIPFVVTGLQGDSSLTKALKKGMEASLELRGDVAVLSFHNRYIDNDVIELGMTKAGMPGDSECRATYTLVGRTARVQYIGTYINASKEPECEKKDPAAKDILFLGSWDLDEKGRNFSMGHLMLDESGRR